jgi:hypothetical protein
MSRRDLRSALLFAAIAAVWALTQGIADLHSVWLTMAPALLIAVPLVGGRYVGSEVIERYARRPPRPRRARGSVPAVRPRAPRAMRRGSLLVARRLAGRAPPAHASLAG